MSRIDRRLTILGFGAGMLSACSDWQVAEGEKPEPRGGLGGTGIVGTLTDFGSLLVNGLRIETAADLAVTSALGRLAVSQLALGHNLTIEAETADGVLIARRVHLAHPVIGGVEKLSADGQSARVAGVNVVAEAGAIGRLQPGMRVAVSGTWRGDTVIASRIDPVASGRQDIIAGEIRGDDSAGLSIGGLTLELNGAPAPLIGGFATVRGQMVEGRFIVENVLEGRFTGAAGPLEALSVEGYLEPTARAPFFAVSGLGHSFDEDAALAPLSENRAVFSGDYIGTFRVTDALPVPEDFAKRRELLRRALADPAALRRVPTR
ncbi:MAG: DUF5666 domain-containing protein [Pseudomonadota bacterium]